MFEICMFSLFAFGVIGFTVTVMADYHRGFAEAAAWVGYTLLVIGFIFNLVVFGI